MLPRKLTEDQDRLMTEFINLVLDEELSPLKKIVKIQNKFNEIWDGAKKDEN